MRGACAAVLLAVLCFALTSPEAVADPLSPDADRQVVFLVRPAGAGVHQEVMDPLAEGGERFLGSAGGPVGVRVPAQDLSLKFWLRLPGHRAVRVLINSATLRSQASGAPYVYPEVVTLVPDNVAVAARDFAGEHPLGTGLVLTAALAAAAAVAARLRRSRREAARARQYDELVITSGDRPDPWVGQLLGRYRLLERLGQGGMGTVYRAVPDEQVGDLDARGLRREAVAVKVMNAEVTGDEEFRQRFLREVRVCQELSHPGIVRLVDWSADGEVLYMAMELIDGRSLRDVMKGRALGQEETLGLAAPALEAVAFAHERGIVHRDLKPENVMLTSDGRVKVMDFGLARGRNYTTVTAAGTALGTPGYMAPEQITDSARKDPRSDEYSLGVMLYEMLCGRRPFEEEDPMAMLFKHLTEEPPALREQRSDLSPEVEAVVMRMIAKDADERFPSVREALGCLRSIERAAAK